MAENFRDIIFLNDIAAALLLAGCLSGVGVLPLSVQRSMQHPLEKVCHRTVARHHRKEGL